MSDGDISDSAGDKFLSELAWRDFSYNLLFHNKELPEKPLREEFADYPWRTDKKGLKDVDSTAGNAKPNKADIERNS